MKTSVGTIDTDSQWPQEEGVWGHQKGTLWGSGTGLGSDDGTHSKLGVD